MHIEGNWHDLQTRGFVVVRDFLPPDLLQALLADANSGAILFQGDLSFRVRDHIRSFFEPINRETDVRLTTVDPIALYFRTKTAPGNVWHTDPPVTYLYGDHYNYVNFWMPLVKDRKSSGMSVIPDDVLRERDPRLHAAQPGRGGAFVVPVDRAKDDEAAMLAWHEGSFPGERKWWDGDVRDPKLPSNEMALRYERNGKLEHVACAVDLDDMSVTPDVGPGDAVLARGDILHRSEDNQQNRIALAVHGIDGESLRRKSDITGLSAFSRGIAGGRVFGPIMSQVMAAFALHGKDTIRSADVADFIDAVRQKKERETQLFLETMPKLPSILGG